MIRTRLHLLVLVMVNPVCLGRGFDHPSVDKYIDEIHCINVSTSIT